MEEKEKKLEPTSEAQLKNLKPEEAKAYREAIYNYDLDKIYNFTMGGFYLRGEINTPEPILRDLIKLPKKITKEDNNTIYLKSRDEILHFGYFEFLVELRFDMPQKGYVTVYLILKEPVKKAGGLFIDYDSNTIAHLVLPNDNYLYSTIATEFNIGGTISGRSRVETDYEPLSVLQAKRYLYILAGHVVFASANENRIFLEKRLNLLKESAVGKLIIEEYNKLASMLPPLSYEKSIYARNQLLSNVLARYEHMFKNDKSLFMSLKLALAQFRAAMNSIARQKSTEITQENFEEYSCIPTFEQEQSHEQVLEDTLER